MGRIIAQKASAQQGNESSKQIVNNTNRYQYDVRGNIVRAHNPDVTLKQTFDRGNRLLSSQQTQRRHTHTLSYHYDDFGRRQRLDLPDGKTLHYRYNRQSQLTAIELSDGDDNTPQTLAVFQYDKQNRLNKQSFGNQIELKQTFDVFHRLTQQTLTHPAQRIYDQCDYQYDAIDQLISRQSHTQQTTQEKEQEENGLTQAKQEAFEYNAIGQLIKESVVYTQAQSITQRKETEFEWDSVGNPISQRTVIDSVENDKADSEPNQPKTQASEEEDTQPNLIAKDAVDAEENAQTIQAVTEGDRLISFADSDFQYDELGNQIRERGIGVQTERAFNAFNQLSSFSKEGVLTQYDYDPLGRRIAKHTEQGQIDFIWDGNQLLGEYQNQNGRYTWYINRPDEFYPVALIKQDQVYYYHLDQLNTPRFVTNQQADVVWENTANAYGYEDKALEQQNAQKEYIQAQSDFYQPIRFQGQYFDQESGFHYNRFRYYCPKQQRFIHQDPIGIVGGINHYQYAPNPVNWVDPMGLACKKEEVKRTVFAGHGSIDQSKSFVVPVGTTLTVYAWDGASITEDLGQRVEQGASIGDAYRKVYKAGDTIPGYVLHEQMGESMLLQGSSIQVSEPTHISELLVENMGDCHWAACAGIWGHENENIVHDSEGIFKKGPGGKFFELQKDGSWEELPDDSGSDAQRCTSSYRKLRGEKAPKENLTTLSQPGGLNATEGARLVKPNGKFTKPTHPLERHGPSVSDDFLIDRVQKELVDKGRSGIRTKFDDRSVMEEAISGCIKENQKSINDWLASNPKAGIPKAFEYNPKIGNLGTGFEVSNSGCLVVKVDRPLENVNVVLMSDGKNGYLIHTAHPL